MCKSIAREPFQIYPLLMIFLITIVVYSRIFMTSIETRIADKIASISAIADELPSVVIIHRFFGETSSIEYMSKRGLAMLDISLEELKMLGESYFEHFMNQQDTADYIPKLIAMLERNDQNEVITFFQQVRSSIVTDWEWHLSSIKVLMRDDEGKPLLLIVCAVPVIPLQHITNKISRLLEENNFIRKQSVQYASLTPREKELLRLIAMGKSNKEISSEMFISVNTTETHRKNIKAKLKVSSAFELNQYASAFDLI